VKTLEQEIYQSKTKEDTRAKWQILKSSERKVDGFLSPMVINGVYYFSLHQLARKIGVQLRILHKNVYLPYSSICPEGAKGLVSDAAFHEWITLDSFTPEKRSPRIGKAPKVEKPPKKKSVDLPIVTDQKTA